MRKRIRTIAAAMTAIFCLQITVFADSAGDSNIDNGGGGLGEGSSQNYWTSLRNR